MIDVTLLTDQRNSEKRQIISENNAPEIEPKEARFLSDKNTSTEKEMIHRGSGGSPQAIKQNIEKREANKAAEPPSSSIIEPKKPLTFKLSPSSTESMLERNRAEQSDREKSESLQSKLLSSPGAFGSQDYLPSLADGDVTLMNAKASKFAVFVRRVALQVFSFVKTSGLTGVTAAEIREAENSVRYRATLGRDGALIRIEKENASGSGRFDEIVYASVKRGSHDPNPPQEALASDGFYHFIFDTRVWLRIEQDRGGFPRERRFILLSTGLE